MPAVLKNVWAKKVFLVLLELVKVLFQQVHTLELEVTQIPLFLAFALMAGKNAGTQTEEIREY